MTNYGNAAKDAFVQPLPEHIERAIDNLLQEFVGVMAETMRSDIDDATAESEEAYKDFSLAERIRRIANQATIAERKRVIDQIRYEWTYHNNIGPRGENPHENATNTLIAVMRHVNSGEVAPRNISPILTELPVTEENNA